MTNGKNLGTKKNWKAGILMPYSYDTEIGYIITNDHKETFVTSGIYERYFQQDGVLYHHILNPDTGMPCNNELLSVTIIAESGILCDCLSTGCFVMGMEDAMELIDGMEGVYAVFVDADYNVYYSEGAKNFVQ